MDVLGWLNEDEGRVLYDFANRSAGLVVELGSYQGRSTICLAQGAERVVTVDHMEGDAADHIEGGYELALRDNLARYGVGSRVQVLHSDTAGAAELVQEPVSLLFIDGDHQHAERDLEAWLPKVTRWIALHDKTVGDVPLAIERLKQAGWQMVVHTGDSGSLVVMEKPGA